VKLRREIARRHRSQPYDLIYQFSNIETLGVPRPLRRSVPLVIHPETHAGGELRWLLAEWRIALQCQPAYVYPIILLVMTARALVQRTTIRQARLLICASSVFRDHMIKDYRFPRARTVVVPNPVRASRFSDGRRDDSSNSTVLVLGRIALRKGVDDVVAVARMLVDQDSDITFRIVGGPSLWSDYTALLEDLPANASYLGQIDPSDLPDELSRTDVLLQASKYEPFGLTVGEALAAGVPVVATSEVGAIEDVDHAIVAEVSPRDVSGMADALQCLTTAVRANRAELSSLARAEAQRLFDPQVVSRRISSALVELVNGKDDWG
jgi:glycosyltransferase involved in cell wall biosynthesis